MQSVELIFICAVAFFMVFVILALLALTMRVIMFVFPEKIPKTDAAVIAAITAAVRTVLPGTQITGIEEGK
ncbi:MAG: hypothetical protein JXB23_03695 [Candidatus Aminicenantes bacterium]|nr:hypothetical protein [Candidatus Aminicenantes bacterium]